MNKFLFALMTVLPLAALAGEHDHWYHNAPEPGTLSLLLLGGAAVAVRRWRRK